MPGPGGARDRLVGVATWRPRSLRACAAAAMCAALAAVLLVRHTGPARGSFPAERMGLVDLASLWAQPARGAARRGHEWGSLLAQDIQKAQQLVAREYGFARPGDAASTSPTSLRQLRRESAAAARSSISTSQLVSAAIRAAHAERAALARERRAEAGLQAEMGAVGSGGDGLGAVEGAADPAALTDDELRASIGQLEADLNLPAKKPARKLRKPSEAQELAAIQKELNAVCAPSARARVSPSRVCTFGNVDVALLLRSCA